MGGTRVRSDRDEDRAARVALTWLAEPGNRTVWAMVQKAGAAATLDRLLTGDLPDSELRAAVVARSAAGDARRLAEAALERADRLGARVVVPDDPDWPTTVDRLATLHLDEGGRVNQNIRPPLCLWARGPWPLDVALDRSVAVVGARAATGYGVHVTTEIAYGLAERDWTVVSGGAFGIDAAAHRAALAANGRTVAVLACGVDRPYPLGNAALFERIAETGLLISEWSPGSEPLRHRFLIRNRVIAAATAGTVVVEAAIRSGAGQTMSRVVALDRAAMIVPGPVTSAMSAGCHEMLRKFPSATLVAGLGHVLEDVGRIGEYLPEPPRAPEHPRDRLDEESALVLEAVPRRGTAGPEQLAATAGLSLRTVLRRLSLLEMSGLIIRRDGGFALATTPKRQADPAPTRQSGGRPRPSGYGGSPGDVAAVAPRDSAPVMPGAAAAIAPKHGTGAEPRDGAGAASGVGTGAAPKRGTAVSPEGNDTALGSPGHGTALGSHGDGTGLGAERTQPADSAAGVFGPEQPGEALP